LANGVGKQGKTGRSTTQNAQPALPLQSSIAAILIQIFALQGKPWVASGSEFGCARLPVPGQKLVKVLDGVIGDTGEHIC
jgi:hypothetical protein